MNPVVVQGKDLELKVPFVRVLELFSPDPFPELRFLSLVCFYVCISLPSPSSCCLARSVLHWPSGQPDVGA